MKRVMFTFPNHTYQDIVRIRTRYSQGLKNQTNLFWPNQATLFSSNQCLIDRTVGHGFTKCQTAPFICKAEGYIVYGTEKRTYEQSLEQCELISGQLCKLF